MDLAIKWKEEKRQLSHSTPAKYQMVPKSNSQKK